MEKKLMKKPQEFTAIQYTGSSKMRLIRFCYLILTRKVRKDELLYFISDDGPILIEKGEWIIKDKYGQFFHLSQEEIDEDFDKPDQSQYIKIYFPKNIQRNNNKCKVYKDGTMIGSVFCKKCRHNKGIDSVLRWVKCSSRMNSRRNKP